MAAIKKNIPIDLIEINEGQLSQIDAGTNKQIGLPRNPRWIRDARFEALKKSIEDAPEMLDIREIVVYTLSSIRGKNGKYIAIGGNMRLRACQELGYKDIPCKVLDPETPMEKLREYAIKDNEAFGQNDYDILANDWDGDELQSWGMELDYLSAGSVDFGNVDDLDEGSYEAPKIKMLECPHCHHVDMAIHFKSFEGNTDGSVANAAAAEDLPEDTVDGEEE